MPDLRFSLRGLWLPLVTPFCNGELDETLKWTPDLGPGIAEIKV